MILPRVLIVDDEPDMVENCVRILKPAGYECLTTTDARRGLVMLESERPDLLLSDLKMPGVDGMELLHRAHELDPALPVIMITAFATIESAVAAVKEGAFDYLPKNFSVDQLRVAVDRALRHRSLQRENRSLKDQLAQTYGLENIIGRSPAMSRIFELVRKAARSEANILVIGESGTGKELIARAIHANSPRVSQPFVPVDCASLPEQLLESELFGHEKGAFTDAKERRLGKLELAHGGTVFFDEIGDMPPELQVKLLRALQERAFERVGGHELIRMDVRVLAATHRDLEAMMKTGKFREDLFYRLNVVTLSLPALRERRGDTPLLVEHFLSKYAETLGERVIAPDTMDRLVGYEWPGNVRELENVIQRAMVMASAGVILPEHLPIGPVSAAAGVTADASLEEIIERKMVECVRGMRGQASANLHGLMVGLVEKPLLRAVMRETKSNQVRAAQLLGINRNTLRKKLKEHGIDPDTP